MTTANPVFMMLSFLGASLLVAVLTPDADTHVTKRPQQSWAVSLSAVNACLSTGRQHPPDHGWQGNKAIPGRATRPRPSGCSQGNGRRRSRSEEHTSELQSRFDL